MIGKFSLSVSWLKATLKIRPNRKLRPRNPCTTYTTRVVPPIQNLHHLSTYSKNAGTAPLICLYCCVETGYSTIYPRRQRCCDVHVSSVTDPASRPEGARNYCTMAAAAVPLNAKNLAQSVLWTSFPIQCPISGRRLQHAGAHRPA